MLPRRGRILLGVPNPHAEQPAILALKPDKGDAGFPNKHVAQSMQALVTSRCASAPTSPQILLYPNCP